jgi:hypothetical protein
MRGLSLLHVCFPLLKLGWMACPIVTREFPDIVKTSENRDRYPTSSEIKALLPGRLAVIGYADPEAGPHAVPWLRDRAIDCNLLEPIDLKDIEVHHVLILERENKS